MRKCSILIMIFLFSTHASAQFFTSANAVNSYSPVVSFVKFMDPVIEVSTKKYSVIKTQSCTEKQDLYYNYLGSYECKPMKAASIQVTIQIHLNDPMYDEALITIAEPAKHKTDEFPIEYVELSEEGLLIFHFSISNQPHVFLLNEVSKTITWESEWGHWKEKYFYK
jgi:hypothetical protein